MERYINKDDIQVIIKLLAYAAESRKEIIKEIWSNSSYQKHPSTHHKDLITRHRSRIVEEQYKILTSDIMFMKYPVIRRIDNLEISMQQKSIMILTLMGMPADVISSLNMVAPGHIYFIVSEYREYFK